MLKTFALSVLVTLASLDGANQALKQGQYEEAIRLYRLELHQNDQDNYQALLGLARAQAYAKKYEEALATYSRLLTAYPQDADGLLGRGLVYAWMQRYDEAIADIDRVVTKNAGYTDAWIALANVYRWAERPKDALNVFEIWLAEQPRSVAAYIARARFYITQRQFVLARADLLKARELGGDAAEIDQLLGRILRQPGALPWELLANYELQVFPSAKHVPWHTLTTGVKYEFPTASLAFQSLTTQRFASVDQAFVLDGFSDLWPQAYGNLRLMGTLDADALPYFDGHAEVFQGFGDIWEVSGAYRQMAFSAANVHFYQLSGAVYLGNWYFRFHPQVFQSGEGPGALLSLWARYFFDSADDFLELRVGTGRRIAVVGTGETGATLAGQNNSYIDLNGQVFINPQLGFFGNLNYNYDETFDDRIGGSIGSKFRF